MAGDEKITGASLSKRWQLSVRQSLYRETGNWFHNLTEFPGVLWDPHGYVIFATEKEFLDCPFLQIGKELSVPKGIKAIPGYTQVIVDPPDWQEPEVPHSDPRFSDGEVAALEGAVSRQIVNHRKREQRLREAKLASVLAANNGRLCCEVEGCGFDFEATYGELGRGYAQVHHLDPLGERSQSSQTTLDRLVVVCANCHVMIHRNGESRLLEDIARRRKAGRRRDKAARRAV